MLYIISIVCIILLASVIWLVFDMKKKIEGGKNGEELAVIKDRLENLVSENRRLQEIVDHKLEQNSQATIRQFGESKEVYAKVIEKITKLDETNKQVVNFSSQLQNLQDILKNPKQRGVLGEYFLEETLKNVLPPKSYQMQYSFKDGIIVDAVVFVKEKIIPIDSKFSLENYERILNANDSETRERFEKQFKQDLKLRIDETSKYVKPEEKTMDFAFMFIPSEAIYYDLLVNKVGAVQVNTRDLIEYAFKEKHVIIVSPTSFLAYLQTVLQGLKALQIEESAKEIKKWVEMLGKHILSYEEYMKKLGTSMSTTVGHYNSAYHEFKKIDKDIARVTERESNVDPIKIEKPDME